MEKTITITEDMYMPLILALCQAKKLNEGHRQFAVDHGKKDMGLMYEKDIRTINQMLEIVREAKWRA